MSTKNLKVTAASGLIIYLIAQVLGLGISIINNLLYKMDIYNGMSIFFTIDNFIEIVALALIIIPIIIYLLKDDSEKEF